MHKIDTLIDISFKVPSLFLWFIWHIDTLTKCFVFHGGMVEVWVATKWKLTLAGYVNKFCNYCYMYLHSPYKLQRKHLNVFIYFWTILSISDEKEVKVRKLLILSVNMLHRWNTQQISHLSDGTMVTIITTKTGTVWYFNHIFTFFFKFSLDSWMLQGVLKGHRHGLCRK